MKNTTTILSAKKASALSIINKLCPMRSRGLAALAAAFGLVLAASHASAQENDWTDNHGTGNQSWNTASNWSLDTVPTDSNTVVIDLSATGTQAHLNTGANGAAGQLIIGENQAGVLDIFGGKTLTVDPFSGGTGTITLGENGNSGVINMNQSGTTLTAFGAILINGGSNTTSPGPSGSLLGSVLNVTGGSSVVAGGGLTLNAQNGLTAQLQVTGTGALASTNVSIENASNFIVGDTIAGTNTAGTNTVNITAGGFIDASSAGEVIIGNGTGTTGTVNVGLNGSDSGRLNAFDLVVGDSGTGALNVTGTGATAAAYGASVIIGDLSGSSGTVTLTDGGTFNTGTVPIMEVGEAMGSTGSVIVGTGPNDAATLDTDTLVVGDAGLGKFTLDGGINDGADVAFVAVSTGNVNVSNSASSAGSYITLTDYATLEANSTGSFDTPGTGTFLIGRDAGSSGLVAVGDLSADAAILAATPAQLHSGNFLTSSNFTNPTETATLNVDTLVVGSYGNGTLIVAGIGDVTFEQIPDPPFSATVNVSTGNVSVGDQVTQQTDGLNDYYSDQTSYNGVPGPNTGTIYLTEGGILNAATTALTGTVDIGTKGTGNVYVGLGGTDSASLNADTLIVGDKGTGALTISGAGNGTNGPNGTTAPATVTVGTGKVTVGNSTTPPEGEDAFTRFGLGTININQGGILDASATGGQFLVGNNGTPAGFIYLSSNNNVVNVGDDTVALDAPGATLKTYTLDVGDTSNGILNVTGTNALVTVKSGNFTVGDNFGSYGVVFIYDGGTVNANSTGTPGVTTIGNNGYGVVGLGENFNGTTEGPGTLTADSLVVGNEDQGYLQVFNGSTATISNTATIGGANGGGGYVDVQGSGSAFNVTTGPVNVGTYNGFGNLSVEDGGAANVDAGSLSVGSNGQVEDFDGSNINVTGGSATVAAGGNFYGGGGSEITINGGTGNFNNSGTFWVNDSDPTPSTGITLFTINGNYVGTVPIGTLQYDTVLDNGAGSAGLLTVYTNPAPGHSGLLDVTGNTSGSSLVHITNFGGAGGQTSGDGIQIMSVGGTNDGTFTLDSRVTAGDYDYSLLQLDSGSAEGLWLQSHISPEVEGAMSVAASQQFLELASLDSLVQREGELAATYQAATAAAQVDPKNMDSKAMAPVATGSCGNTSEVWTRGIYRNDDVHTSVGLHQDSGVGQIGGDYQFCGLMDESDRLYLGGLASYGQSSGHTTVQDVHIDGSDVGFGAYATYLNGGFYVDAVVQGNISHDTVKTQFGNFGASGTGVSASLESGYAFNVGSGVKIEPQAQFVYETESYNHPTDDLGRVYDFNDPDFLQARWGVRIDKSFEYSPGLHITPYLRVNGLEQILGDNQVTVDGTTFTEDISGLSVAVDGGVTMDVSKNAALYVNGNSAWGEKDDSYGATGGVKISW